MGNDDLADLEAYLATHRKRPGPPCWVCTIPEAPALNEAHKRGGGVSGIHRWLLSAKGYSQEDCTYGKLRDHFRNGHHER
jgi:hypothetical protein